MRRCLDHLKARHGRLSRLAPLTCTAPSKDMSVKNNVEMDCPHCSVALVMSDRQGIEIDYCPKCRGVWLDRGELDKIIERSSSVMPQVVQAPSQPQAPQRQYEQPQAPQRYYEQQQGYGHKRRKSFLEELFD